MHFYLLIFSVLDVAHDNRWQLASRLVLFVMCVLSVQSFFLILISLFFCRKIESDFHSQFSVPEKEKGKC